jgi:hypothetical protein
MTDRKKPGVMFWATAVVVVVLVGYPLSFGPAVWATRENIISIRFFWHPYRPLARLAVDGPPWCSRPLFLYGSIFGDPKVSSWIIQAWTAPDRP